MHYIKAVGDRLLVIRASVDEFADKDAKIQKVNQNDADRPFHGRVDNVGPDVKRCKAGDYILFSRYAGIDGPSPDITQAHHMLIGDADVAAVMDVDLYREKLAEAKAAEADARDAIAAERKRQVDAGENGSSPAHHPHLYLPRS